jgi:hypothetical protein
MGLAWAWWCFKLLDDTPLRNLPDLSAAVPSGHHQEYISMDKPVVKQAPLYGLLRIENIKAFIEQRDHLDTSELNNDEHRDFGLRSDTAALL